MIRTANDLDSKLADDLVWRKRELTELNGLIKSSAENLTRQKALIRAATAMLYAHWEGFIKNAGLYYLEFVLNQRHKHNELKANFVALSLKSKLTDILLSKKASTAEDVVEFFFTKLESRIKFSYKNAIRTESNLTSTVLKEILWTLGFSESYYQTKYTYIDSKLVDRRNHIAHGEYLDLNSEEYFELHKTILNLIEIFRNEIGNAGTTRSYLRPT